MSGLSAGEERALQILRKKEQSWRWYRWVSLALGFGLLGLTWYNQRVQIEALKQVVAPGGSDYLPILLPVFARGAVAHYMTMLAGVGVLVFVVAHWHGSPLRKLLLRLYADREKG